METIQRARISWGGVIAGSLAATAVFLVLFGFGASLGLALGSTAPTWRDASFALWLLSSLYLMLSALLSFALGGYVAGRIRTPADLDDQSEQEMNSGLHGLLVWALAVLLGALLVSLGARTLGPVISPSGQQAGQMSSIGGENLLAFEIDKLFRTDKRPPSEDMTYVRSEAGRILLTSSSHTGVLADDRAYLARLVSARTGLAGGDAQQRVNAIIEQSRTSLSRARKAGVLIGFVTAASLLLGAAVSWFAAQRGERDSYGDDISSYDTMFRTGGMRTWLDAPRPRTRKTPSSGPAAPGTANDSQGPL